MSKKVVPKLKLSLAVIEIQTHYKLTDDEIIKFLKIEIEKRK